MSCKSSEQQKGVDMAEVTTSRAAEILGTNQRTIQRRVDDGTLPARRQGLKGIAYIRIEDLKAFAAQYGYRFDEARATQETE